MLTKPLEPTQKPLYEVLQQVAELRAITGLDYPLLELSYVQQIGKIDTVKQQLTLYAKNQHYIATQDNPWIGFKTQHWSNGDEITVTQILTPLVVAIDACQTHINTLNLPIDTYLATLKQLNQLDTDLFTEMPCQPDMLHLLPALLDTVILQSLQEQQKHYYAYQHDYAQAQRILALTDIKTVTQLIELLNQLVDLNDPKQNIAEIDQQLQYTEALSDYLQSLLQKQAIFDDFILFWQLNLLIKTIPIAHFEVFIPLLKSNSLNTLYTELLAAQQQAIELQAQQSVLAQFFNFAHLPTQIELEKITQQFKQLQPHWYAYLIPLYYQQQFTIKQFLQWESLVKQPDIIIQLEKLQQFQIQLQQFETYYQNKLGEMYIGLKTDWTALITQLLWLMQFHDFCSNNSIFLNILTQNTDLIDYLSQTLQGANAECLAAMQLLETDLMALNTPLDELSCKQVVKTKLEQAKTLKTIIAELRHYPHVWQCPINQLRQASQQLSTFNQVQQDLSVQIKTTLNLADEEIDFDPLFKLVDWLIAVQADKAISKPLIQQLFQSDFAEELPLFYEFLLANQAFNTELNHAIEKLAQINVLPIQNWLYAGDFSQCTLLQLQRKLTHCLNTLELLNIYLTNQQLEQQLKQAQLDKLLAAIVQQSLTAEQAVQHYQYAFYYSLVRQAVAQHPELALFSRDTHLATQQYFTELEQQLLQANQQKIAYQLAQNNIEAGQSSGLVGDLTEHALLAHEIRKKTRHLPVRQLIKRAAKALKALKPCFMMSPLSVAHYLEPDKLSFDVLIIDEASQVRPEDALGAIARCQQLVIVGDSKQLPPTRFFAKNPDSIDSIEQADKTAIEGYESILDMPTLQRYQLQWHYRSKHESLIHFSNQTFYANQLLIFPSVQPHTTKVGIVHHYLATATYARGTNLLEAEHIIQAIIQHFQTDNAASLGVATFNHEQQELISDLLDKACQADSVLEQKIRATEQCSEPFFIKNLENVQGDERDIILVSSVYGKDKHQQRVYQRFGPIANEDGWRRLNVIFTRARHRLELFTSLRSSDIEISPHSRRGIQVWRAYLAYSENASQAGLNAAKNTYMPAKLTRIIEKILHQQGYQTVSPVGSTGFFIDIGVLDPAQPDRYIAGIICDSPQYYQQESATDRDYLQPAILRGKGWQIYQVWALDWFKNKGLAAQNLLDFLQKAK